jgi:hypothetical protein
MVDERVFNEFQNGFPPGAGVIVSAPAFISFPFSL